MGKLREECKYKVETTMSEMTTGAWNCSVQIKCVAKPSGNTIVARDHMQKFKRTRPTEAECLSVMAELRDELLIRDWIITRINR